MTAATTPSRAEFLRLADTARVIPVVRTVLADGRLLLDVADDGVGLPADEAGVERLVHVAQRR